MANTSYNAVPVGDTATLIIASNSNRKGLLIVNNSAVTVYIGPDASITKDNAIPILASGTFMDTGLQEAWRSAVYGIVVTGTADVRYWEYGQ